ncbi:hypothetical protein M409DRAFT_60115 [Zasmidium cellare ATCC 36951]|uniref:SnoaL-like domain-containing protein n=1 Tax=Zasmidium cellare ATCC 36951 TaxID=1080233 RepID=A0A6A6BZQ5_ZASCE|nr:uncharacterized protein M409DRAFT_60115 [Zasmidium cellare ATCC 36951]KAF2160195.1 hypothetical protein M409DRAFT_60115 [Zasmidium cellare ATCC 36951]
MSSDTSPLSKETIAHLQHIAQRQIDAINARDLSIDSPAWANCAKNFIAERGGMRGNQQKYRVDLQGLLDDIKAIIARSPNYHIDLNECSIQPGATADSAMLHAPHAVTGDPPGIVLCVMGVMAFEIIDNEWQLLSSTLPTSILLQSRHCARFIQGLPLHELLLLHDLATARHPLSRPKPILLSFRDSHIELVNVSYLLVRDALPACQPLLPVLPDIPSLHGDALHSLAVMLGGFERVDMSYGK